MNDETALKELLSMSRIYSTRGQTDKAEECMQLARQIQNRLAQPNQEAQCNDMSRPRGRYVAIATPR